jgi:Zn-dependent M16 (insulinase) family peptidase
LSETLDDFDESLRWLKEQDHDAQDLEESILGVIGQLDRPRSPAGAARHAFNNRLFGRTPEQRSRFRERVLAVTIDDMKRVAETWLKADSASTAVITSHENRKLVENLGLDVQEL